MALIDFSGCDTCTLRKQWPQLANPKMPIIRPSDPGDVRILVLGEAPGAEEDKAGIPFVDDSGKLLREHIPGRWLADLYWGNIIRCHPFRNETPSELDVESCTKGFLEPDLAEIDPHLIIAVGGTALQYFYPSGSISFVRGLPFPWKLPNGNGVWIYPILHPSYILRTEDERQKKAMLPLFKSDLKRCFQQIEKWRERPIIPRIPERAEFHYPRNAKEAISLIEKLSEPYCTDFETFKLRPYMRDARLLTAGFSDGKLTVVFPVEWPGFNWGVSVIEWAFNRDVVWCAHEAAMELSWIITYSHNVKQSFMDTASIARMLHQRTMVGALAKLTSLHLGFDIKKVTGVDSKDIVTKSHSLEQTLYYNGLDAWSDAQCLTRLQARLPEDQWPNVERADNSTYSTVLMELRGMPVDLIASLALKRELVQKEDAAENAAKSLSEIRRYERDTGKTFHISAPEEVGEILVNYCGVKLPPTKRGYSTDESYLSKHVDLELVRHVLDYRQWSKLRSTYVESILNGELLGADGWLHPMYNVLLTATGRLSSEHPNFQNFPKRKNKEIRAQIVAPPGHLIVAFDYGQLEARVYAMATRDRNLVRSIINKEDIHQKWLDRIIQLYPDYISRLAQKTGQTDEAKIMRGARDIIKVDFVFASFYGSEVPAMVKRTHIPEDICNQVWSEFWSEYPGVRAWQQRMFAEYERTGCVRLMTGMVRNEALPGNEPTNTPIQGTAAHLVLEAQNACTFRAIRDNEDPFMTRFNIHDDLGFFVPDNSDAERYIEETAAEIVLPRFSFVNVPLMTECRVGPNWKDLEPIGKFEGSYHQ